MTKWTIRDATPADKNFIYASWLRGLYYGDSWFKEIPKSIFMEAYHSVLETILENPTTQVKVACLHDDPEVILGYAVLGTEGRRVHWVFVKKAWRTIGIAKKLVPEKVDVATHLTRVGMSLMKKRPNMIFNPFAL